MRCSNIKTKILNHQFIERKEVNAMKSIKDMLNLFFNELVFKITCRILLFLSLLIYFGCSSPQKSYNEDSYYTLLKQFTQSSREYDGLYNTFDLHVTLLNSPIRNYQLMINSENFKWDALQIKSEKEKEQQFQSSKTEVFISFFTPDAKHRNLTDSKKSIWKIFLDVEGHRYIAKIIEVKKTVDEITKFYPYHNRWSYTYIAQFSVPTTIVEKSKSSLTITGTLGSATLHFESIK